MAQKRVQQSPSETAFFTALRRALANKAYPDSEWGADELAAYFLPAHFRFFLRFKRIRENTRKRLDGFFPGMTEYLIARTIYFDRAKRGLTMVEHLDNEQIEQRFLVAEDGSLLGKITGHFRFVMAVPAGQGESPSIPLEKGDVYSS